MRKKKKGRASYPRGEPSTLLEGKWGERGNSQKTEGKKEGGGGECH